MIKIGQWQFDGPYAQVGNLNNAQGVYVILGRNSTADNWTVVDVGESGEGVYDRVLNHDRENCWKRQGFQYLAVSVLYTPGYSDAQRRVIEQALRNLFQPACGVR